MLPIAAKRQDSISRVYSKISKISKITKKVKLKTEPCGTRAVRR